MTNSDWPKQWQQLAVMLDAGLSVESALLALDRSGSKYSNIIRLVAHDVKLGIKLSASLKKNRLIRDADELVLQIAEKAGKLPDGLNFLANRQLAWKQNIDHLQSGLWLPKILLILGAFAGLLIHVLSENMNAFQAAWQVLPVLVYTWGLMWLLVFLIKQDCLTWLSLLWRFKAIRQCIKLYQLNFEQNFYRLLIWQTDSGIPIDQALRNMSILLSDKDFKQKILSCAGKVNQGEDLLESLNEHYLILSDELKRVLRTAMQAGAFEKAMLHHIDWQRQTCSDYAKQFFKWLPRFFYLIALLAISRMMIV